MSVGASPNRFEAKRFLLGTRNFLLHWSHLGLQYERLFAPDNDTVRLSAHGEASTDSLDSPDAPRRVVQEAKSFVLPLRVRHSLFGETTKTGMPHQTKLVLRIDGFMHEAIFLNATPYQLSRFCTVPNVCPMSFGHATRTGTLRERTVHLASKFVCVEWSVGALIS